MKTKEFNNLKVGQTVYLSNGNGGQVSKINRTTKRVDAIGLGNDIFWRFIHKKRLESGRGFLCGACGSYEVVEKMEFR